MELLSVALIGIMGCILIMILKKLAPEYGTLAMIAVILVITFLCLGQMETVLGLIELLQDNLGADTGYIGILIRIIGISYMAQFASEICKDAGNSSIGTAIELFAKLSIVSISMPLVLAVMQLIAAF